jgi:hypothetical protein
MQLGYMNEMVIWKSHVEVRYVHPNLYVKS